MTGDDEADAVLRGFWPTWAGDGTRSLPSRLTGDGFSGARLWKIETASGAAVLRRWPREHPDGKRLAFIHGVLRQAAERGFQKLPMPIPVGRIGNSSYGDPPTFVEHDGHFWELDTWLPGAADYWTRPSEARLRAALAALAEFHRAAEDRAAEDRGSSPSPGMAERLSRLRWFLAEGGQGLRAAVHAAPGSPIGELVRQWLLLFPIAAAKVESQLAAAANLSIALQPCLRDIWHDHVLFVGDEVSGLLDVGAMRMETVAADVARLLGSLLGDDPEGWQTGVAAYETIRPLDSNERQLIAAFDNSTVALTGMNWGEWLFVEGRFFGNLSAVQARLESSLRRLTKLRNSCLGGRD